MNKLDEDILEQFFVLQTWRERRLRLQRIWEPETFSWAKDRPAETWSTAIWHRALIRAGDGPEQLPVAREEESMAKKGLEEMALLHPLWPHFERIKGFGPYLCGAYVAAAGDITKAPSVSSHWKGMGLDVLPNGRAPRRIRGLRKVERKVPCPPHVSLIGEQIRQQMIRAGGRLYGLYIQYKEAYAAKYPDRVEPLEDDGSEEAPSELQPHEKSPRMHRHKAALRCVQKLLYANLWKEHRLSQGLPVPSAYVFDILGHKDEISIVDLYDA